MIIRRFSEADYSGLQNLWHTVFGDDEKFISHFINDIIKPSRGFLAEDAGVIAAAAYIIDGITVLGRAYPYIYAVATLPKYRSRGLGKAVSIACAEQIESEGGVPSLHPAEKTLFSWYGKIGFKTSFTIRESMIKLPDVCDVALTPLSSKKYAEARRNILLGNVFADYSNELFQWMLDMCGNNGGYFAFDGGLICARKSGHLMVVPELLATHNSTSAIATLSRKLVCSECSVRTPALEGFEGFGFASDFISSRSVNEPIGYWGIVFD